MKRLFFGCWKCTLCMRTGQGETSPPFVAYIWFWVDVWRLERFNNFLWFYSSFLWFEVNPWPRKDHSDKMTFSKNCALIIIIICIVPWGPISPCHPCITSERFIHPPVMCRKCVKCRNRRYMSPPPPKNLFRERKVYPNFVLILYNFVHRVLNFVYHSLLRYWQFKFGMAGDMQPQMQF